jgi:predicted GH43/DUF377 family glycosyl hydrolase
MKHSHHLQPAEVWRGFLKICRDCFVLWTSLAIGSLYLSTAVQAAPGIQYVDGGSGNNTPTCGGVAQPCATLTYTLQNRAGEGDLIRVAQGTYLENFAINKGLTLEGGYEAENWNRDPVLYPTILDGSGMPLNPGSWDGFGVRYPYVILDGAAYKMWYTGFSIDSVGSLGYATSADGLTWVRPMGGPVLEPGSAGEWDDAGIEDATVIKDGSVYKMWYSAFSSGATGSIGYATSSDGLHWTKFAGNPILSAGTEGWNNRLVIHPQVLYFSGQYHLWALTAGDDGSGFSLYFAYATSADGIHWDWDPANPVFAREWEDWLWRPFVIQDGVSFKMWYSLSSGGENGIGYATSPDGLDWTRLDHPALSGTAGEWDEGKANDPMVFFENGTYYLRYDNTTSIGMATSADASTWTKSAGNPVFGPGTPPAWGLPVVSVETSAAVVLDGFTITGGSGEEAGGVHGGEADLTIRSCTIIANMADGSSTSWAGGGILSSGNLTIEDSMILDNWAVQGAAGVRSGDDALMMTNTLVANNTGDMGIHTNGPAQLVNVTLANNEGGILVNPPAVGKLAVTNSILTGNGWQISVEGGGTAEVKYSLVEGGWSGTGNLEADPLFFDPEQRNYRLQPGSPAIDAGTNTGAPDHDLEGTERPLDGNLDRNPKVDMGAYEYRPPTIYLPVVMKMN